MVADVAEVPRAGALVFRVELSIDCCPTMNRYASMAPWQRKKARVAIMKALGGAAPLWSACRLGVVRAPSKKRGRLGAVVDAGAARRRRVVVTRYSARRPDEVSCDAVGGKLPIDCLVRAGILRDDSAKWCEREAHWQARASGADGFLTVEVWEVAP